MRKIFILLLITILILCLYNDQVRLKVRRIVSSIANKVVLIVEDLISKETTKGKQKLPKLSERTSKKIIELLDKEPADMNKQKNQTK